MIGEATTVELSPTGIDGDNFDISSLRDGASGEDLSFDIGETVADSVEQFDLVAVASGGEKLETFMDESIDSKDVSTSIDTLLLAGKSEVSSPENQMSEERRAAVCQGVASVACASCVARDDCPILRIRNFASENLQPAPERESYLSELLNDNDDGIVVAGYVNTGDGEVNSINTNTTEVNNDNTEEPTDKTIFQEQKIKTSINETVEVSGEDMDIEVADMSSYSTEMKLPVVDAVSDAVHNDNKKPTLESLDAPKQTETAPVLVVIDKDTQAVDRNSNSLENETVYPAASEDTAAASVESEPSRAAENDESAFTSISRQQHLAVQFDAVKADKSAITGPIDNSGTKAPAYTQSSEINIDATPDYNNFVESTDSIDNERLVDTTIIDEAKVNLPNEEIDVLAADQIFTDTQDSSTKQLDYGGTAVERSHDKDNDFWAEEDTVFFVERQESPAVESEVSSAEAVTIALPIETITVREETDDYKPVEQVTISTSSIIETIPDIESDEVAAKIPEECPVPREKCEFRFVKTSEKSDLLRSDDKIESVIMDVSDIKSGINLSGEQVELNDALDDCVYNGEENVANGDDLLMNIHPSFGLWSDDSPLNPEEGVVTTTQSAADDSSLVSRLVGMLVVAMCVARGRQARAIPNS
jgi:hypothetical protein cdiviTM7_00855